MDVVCIVPSSCTDKIFTNLSSCIESLYQSIKKSSFTCQIIVVTANENISKKIQSYLKNNNVRLIRLNSDMNKFSALNNYAIESVFSDDEYQKTKAVLLINDDASVANNFFAILSKHNLDEKLFLAPHVSDLSGSIIDSFGVQYFSSGYAKNSTNTTDNTTLASASCLVITINSLKTIIQAYGYIFNPLYDYYLEDVELCIRSLMIGIVIKKDMTLKACHSGSATSGKKSYFSMFNTYKNVLWTVLLTWPMRAIIKNLGKIILVQLWIIFFSLISYGPKLYLSVIFLTVKNIKQILKYRKNNLKSYKSTLCFEDLFNRHAFRTYHGLYIW